MISFVGDYQGTVDDKGRIVLPSAFKAVMKNVDEKTFVVRKDFHEPCLLLYPESEWNKFLFSIDEASSITNKEDRALKRSLGKNVSRIGFSEKNGRMLIPKKFLDMVNIKKEVVLLGVTEYIEIWDRVAFENIDDGSEDFSKKLSEKI
jgi:MraZ protein